MKAVIKKVLFRDPFTTFSFEWGQLHYIISVLLLLLLLLFFFLFFLPLLSIVAISDVGDSVFTYTNKTVSMNCVETPAQKIPHTLDDSGRVIDSCKKAT